MNRAIERRLAAAERRLNPLVPPIKEIMILGGLPGSHDPTFATAGDLRWERAPAELFPAFRARAVAAATAAGEPFVVMGGLPERFKADRTDVKTADKVEVHRC